MPIKYTTLGSTDIKIPQQGFGLMSLSHIYGNAGSDEERFKLLDHAWEIGNRNWDTAWIYGDSETVIGKWFALHPERRKDIFLATKFGIPTYVRFQINNDPAYCRESIESSLENLQTDYVDLFYVHRIDKNQPIEIIMETLAELVKEGKVKNIGLSECHATTLERAHVIHPIAAVQVEYSPWCLDIETLTSGNLLKTCKRLNVSVFAYSPLGVGFLTGTIKSLDDFEPDDARRNFERFSPENFPKNLDIVKALYDTAARKGVTPAQLTLAWLMRQSPLVIPIPGTRRIAAVGDNWKAHDVVLSDEDDKELRSIITKAALIGGRPAGGAGMWIKTVPRS